MKTKETKKTKKRDMFECNCKFNSIYFQQEGDVPLKRQCNSKADFIALIKDPTVKFMISFNDSIGVEWTFEFSLVDIKDEYTVARVISGFESDVEQYFYGEDAVNFVNSREDTGLVCIYSAKDDCICFIIGTPESPVVDENALVHYSEHIA